MYDSSTKETLDSHCDFALVTSWQMWNSVKHTPKIYLLLGSKQLQGERKRVLKHEMTINETKISNISYWERAEQTQTLNFFLVLTCLYTGSNIHFGMPQCLELVNFLLFISSWLIFYWHLHLIMSCCRLSQKDTSCLLTSACRVGRRDVHFLWTCTNNPQTSSPP